MPFQPTSLRMMISELVDTAIQPTALSLNVVVTLPSARAVTETATEPAPTAAVIESDQAQKKTDMIPDRIKIASNFSYIYSLGTLSGVT